MLRSDTACVIVATRIQQWQDNSLTFCDHEEELPTTIWTTTDSPPQVLSDERF